MGSDHFKGGKYRKVMKEFEKVPKPPGNWIPIHFFRKPAKTGRVIQKSDGTIQVSTSDGVITARDAGME